MSARHIVLSSLVAVALFAAPATADEPTVTTETAEIALHQLEARGALTLLRTIANTRGLKLIDDRTVAVTDSPEVVALAKSVVDLAENPSELAGEVTTHTAPDGSVIASVRLQHAALTDVGKALRTEVSISRMAFNDAMSTVVVRDTPEQVQAALDVIRRLEQPQH
jgi:type II secretory pathway component GspD/PulD (secretin)